MSADTHVEVDVTTTVVAAFQGYLGTGEPLPLDGELLNDLGIDSLALVTVLMDLAAALRLDLARARGRLGDLLTIDDVAAAVAGLVALRDAA